MKVSSINPLLLKWARESLNLSIEEVSEKTKKSQKTILAWEAGDEFPSYAELEKLAYQIYKRPIAVFFFPSAPAELDPKQSMRTLPQSVLSELPSSVYKLFRRAQSMQLNLEELAGNKNPADNVIFKSLKLGKNDNINNSAKKVRAFLKISVDEQRKWKTTEEALEKWRSAIESSGIYVFKDAFKYNDLSGFCLYHDEFPIIYVNNSMPKTRQTFTLFHELCHLLFRLGGIDKTNLKYIEDMSDEGRQIETFCNKFAAELLVPSEEFNKELKVIGKIDEAKIEKLASIFCVSREVILRKLLDRKLVTQSYYESKSKEWAIQAEVAKADKSGGHYYHTQMVYLGKNYLGLAFEKYFSRKISVGQLAEFLNIKVSSVPGIESAFLRSAA